jgi:NifU-like protein involved in Fe-S cluster formation
MSPANEQVMAVKFQTSGCLYSIIASLALTLLRCAPARTESVEKRVKAR